MLFRKALHEVTLPRWASIPIYFGGLAFLILYRSLLVHFHLPMSLSSIMFWVILFFIPLVRRPVVFALLCSKSAMSIFLILASNRPIPTNGIVSNIVNLTASLLFAELLYRIIYGLRDMNKRLIIESERAKAASEAKAAFLANMSHEIRTPLSGIRGITEMMISEGHRAEDDKKHLSMIKSSSDTLLHIVNNVLDFSRNEAGKSTVTIAPCSIRMVFNKVVDSIRPTLGSKDVALQLKVDSALPEQLLIDEVKITQILTNLISNGVKFTDEGSVIVAVKYDKNGNLRFRVSDTGIGIPENKQHLVFTEFERINTSYEKYRDGTGLGLAITKGLVEQLGGTISLKSFPGDGTIFTVAIPAETVPTSDNDELPLEPELFPNSIISSGHSILLAEDNPVNQTYIKHFLEKHGYALTIVENGEDAIRMFKRNPYNLVLMDIQMPVKSGVQAAIEIRNFERKMAKVKTPILALTASITENEQEHFLNSGMDEVCPKPIDVNNLLERVQVHLN